MDWDEVRFYEAAFSALFFRKKNEKKRKRKIWSPMACEDIDSLKKMSSYDSDLRN